MRNVCVGTRSANEPSQLPRTDNALRTLSAGDEAIAWQMVTFNWRMLASITGLLCAGLVAADFYIKPTSYFVVFAVAALYWQIGHRCAVSAEPRKVKATYCLATISQLTWAVPVMATLGYLAIAVGLPLQDMALLDWDRTLGLDFRSYLNFFNSHREFLPLVALSYGSIGWQLAATALVLPLSGYYRRSGEWVCAYTLTLFATICISTLLPALGAYDVLGLTPADHPNFAPQAYYDSLREVPLLRAGEVHVLDLPRLVGLLTFPSFHAASAVLYIWGLWPLRWLTAFTVPWNIAMIAATPLGGGHYFIDVIAGILLAVSMIAAARLISSRLATISSVPTDALSEARRGAPIGNALGPEASCQ